jgi:SAM-dependent methyltransferase
MSGTSYTPEEFSTNYPPGMHNYYWTHARNRILLRELRKEGLSGRKFLEIGCATGLVVSYLRQHGLQVWGAESGDPVVLDGAEGFIFIRQDCLDLPVEFRKSIEVVMLLDVIEHLEDPAGFLKSVAEAYPNARHMILSVPSRRELWSSYDVEYRHFRRYDFQKMRETVAPLPYRLHKMNYLFTLLYLPAWIAAKTSGKRNHVVRPPLTRGAIRIHRLLSWLLHMDYLIIPGAVWGSSILAVLKRGQ